MVSDTYVLIFFMNETEEYFGLIGPHVSVVVVATTRSCFDAILRNVHKNSEMETQSQSSPAAAGGLTEEELETLLFES